MRKVFKRITALALTAAVAISAECGGVRIQSVSPEVRISKAAESSGRYVADIMVSHRESKEAAQEELGEEYTILDRDFNEGMSGHSWIGYTTTNDADMAIKDLKVMGMDGNYSESDYKELLDRHKEVIAEQLNTVIPAIIEYTKNYDAGMKTASYIHTLLNVFHEDDSDKNVGDLLLELGRRLVDDRNDLKAKETLEMMFVQGNDSAIRSIEKLLTQAQDTKLVKKGSWLTRMSLLGPDGLYAVYKQAYPGKTRSYVNKMIENDLGDEANAIFTEINNLQSILKEGEESKLYEAMGDEKATDEIVSEYEDKEEVDVSLDSDTDELLEASYMAASDAAETMELNAQMTEMVVIENLKNTPYGSTKSMYDFFMDKNLKKSDLYTMAYVLSDGQKSIINDLGLYPVFESILSEYNENVSTEAEADEDMDLSDMDEGILSVYDGVDRSVFDGDTAITADTLKNMETKQVDDVLSPEGNKGNLKLAVAMTVVGSLSAYMAVKSFAYDTKMLYKPVREVVYEITPKVTKMQNEFRLMIKYENAWKLNWIEMYAGNSYLPEGFKLSALEYEGADTAKTINETYKYAAEKLKNTRLGEQLEKFTVGNKEAHMHFYGNAIDANMQKTITKQVPDKVSKVPKAGWGARIGYTLGAVLALAFAGYEIYLLTRSHSVEFTHIPANMVYKTTEGDVHYMTYHAVRDKAGNVTDLHDKKGDGWQVIYTTTDSNAGDPVLASSLTVSDSNKSSDPDIEYLLDFDQSSQSNLADKKYTGKSTKSVYITYRTGTEESAEVEGEAASDDEAPEQTSVFAWPGMLWVLLAILVIAGIAAGAGVYYRKRKK